MEFRILGPLEVRREGHTLTLGGSKQRALLTILLTQPNKVLAVDRLTELLWGDDAPATAAHAIEVYVSQLRKTLEPGGAPYRMLLTSTAGYCLRIDPGEVDVVQFQNLVSSAEQLSPERALVQLNQALALWRGAALADFAAEQFARGEVARLDELHLHAIEQRIDAELALGRDDSLIGELVSLTTEHPFRERLCGQLMLAFYRSGRQAEASDVYQRTRERLVDQLGMEPGPELQAMLKRILQQDSELSGAGLEQELPAGTVTFLMTDIEESTRAWDESPIAAKQALDRHNAIVTEHVVTHQGQVVESGREGDSFLAAFRQARDGVACALDTQRALQQEPWPDESRIRVRIAVHSGEAELQSGHYVGAALYRCARLMASGHGGQVVLSQATEQLVVDTLPDGADLLDLGLHRLPDISRPEHVFQLLHADLASEFPPLKSLERPHTNLPNQLTSFIGREEELRAVTDAVDRFRLVTLAGVGGTGKTRLAVQIGGALLDRFTEGVWFVDLTPLSDARLIPQAMAASLGIREQPGRDLLATVVDHLRQGSTLVILDNCEHVIDEAARVTAALITHSAMLHVLVTSRERLRVDGEHVYQVPPLHTPTDAEKPSLSELREFESVQLFVDRAALLVPLFSIDESSGRAVAELCIKLDGIPLAIELAAAQVRALGPREILDNLGDRFSVLASGNRTGPLKQRTLWATLQWSYELLDQSEQALFRRLAVFAGGFDIAAANAVLGDVLVPSAGIAAVIAKLTDKSLVIAEPGARATRYRLLETVREYALELLRSADEIAESHRRHAQYFLDTLRQTATEYGVRGAARWRRQVGDDYPNLVAALAWAESADAELCLSLAAGLGPFWVSSGYTTEGLQRLLSALSRPSDNLAERLTAHLYIAWLYWLSGGVEEAEAWADATARAMEGVDDPALRGRAMHIQGLVAADASADYARAGRHLAVALDLARQANDSHGIAETLNVLGSVAMATGDLAAARDHLNEALAVSESIEYENGISQAHLLLGGICYLEGKMLAANQLLMLAIDRGLATDYRWVVATGLDALSWSVIRSGDTRNGLILVGAAEGAYRWAQVNRTRLGRQMYKLSVPGAIERLGEEAGKLIGEGRRLDINSALELAHQITSGPGSGPMPPDR
jgi:predicted ATPase/DNA-binding SARP family transcriptional activator